MISNMLLIKDLLPKAVKKAGIKQSVDIALALERAEKILVRVYGKEILFGIKPAYIQYKTLVLACTDHTAASQIGYCEEEIIEYINQGFAKKVVERISLIT